MLIHLENENFDELLKGKTVLVDFYAEWCGPCKMLAPILEELSAEGVEIIKVDVDVKEELVQRFGITNMPTLLLFKDGEVVKKELGYKPIEFLREFVK